MATEKFLQAQLGQGPAEDDPSARRIPGKTAQEKYVDLLRIIAELETKGVPPTWDRLLYAFTGIGDKELAAPSRQKRKKAQKQITDAAQAELSRLGETLAAQGVDVSELKVPTTSLPLPSMSELATLIRIEETKPDKIMLAIAEQAERVEGVLTPDEEQVAALTDEMRDVMQKALKAELSQGQMQDLENMIAVIVDTTPGQALSYEKLNKEVFSGTVKQILEKEIFPHLPLLRTKHLGTPLTQPVERLIAGIPEEAQQPEEDIETVDSVLMDAARRHFISQYYLSGENQPITMDDINANNEKYKYALNEWVGMAKRYIEQDQDADLLSDPSADPIKIAMIKARYWLDENGDPWQPPRDDPSYDLVQQFRGIVKQPIMIPGLEGQGMAPQLLLDEAYPDFVVALLKKPNRFGAGFASTQDMKTQEVTPNAIIKDLRKKISIAGGDVNQPNVMAWIQDKAQSIMDASELALANADAASIASQDQSEAWKAVYDLTMELQFDPETIESEGWQILALGGQEQFFRAWVQTDSGMGEAIPDPMNRELLIKNGWNAYKQAWLKTEPDPATGQRQIFSDWLQENGAILIPEILPIAQAVAGGLGTPEGRISYFEDLARATKWVGTPILPVKPSESERGIMDMAIAEAEREFQNNGEIPGTYEGIIKEKIENWGDSTKQYWAMKAQYDPSRPPGMDMGETAEEALAVLEARLGPNLTIYESAIRSVEMEEAIRENNDQQIELKRKFDVLKTAQDRIIEETGEPNADTASLLNRMRIKLKAAESEGSKLLEQKSEIGAEGRRHKLLTDDAELARAFATGNRDSLETTALDRNISEDQIAELVEMQRRSGLRDQGEKRFKTPEALAAEKRMRSIDAAKQAARTIRHDAQGNLMPGDPTIDEYNVRTGVRTDPEGNIVEPIPSDPAARVDEEGNPLPGMERMIPNTDLLDTQENRDAISGGMAAPGTRQGEGFETDDEGRFILDDEGNPIRVAPITRGPDYEPPDLILGTRQDKRRDEGAGGLGTRAQPTPKLDDSVAIAASTIPAFSPFPVPVGEGQEEEPPEGLIPATPPPAAPPPIPGLDAPVGEGQRAVLTSTEAMGIDPDVDEEELVPGRKNGGKGAKNAASR